MGEYTPRPWHIAGERGEWVNDARNTNICRVNSAVRLTPSGKYVQGNKPHSANARLISAAPDLYEVLKGFLEWAENGGPVPPIEPMLRAVRKAEGRNNDV